MVHSNTVFPLCVCNANVQNPICNQASKKIESLHGIVINLLPGYLAQNSPFDNAVAFCITLLNGFYIFIREVRRSNNLYFTSIWSHSCYSFCDLYKRGRRKETDCSFVDLCLFQQWDIELLNNIVYKGTIFIFYTNIL